ncbi:hypothetical protein [Streptomyces sp. NPDC002088]
MVRVTDEARRRLIEIYGPLALVKHLPPVKRKMAPGHITDSDRF